jgi:hypothetical protein
MLTAWWRAVELSIRWAAVSLATMLVIGACGPTTAQAPLLTPTPMANPNIDPRSEAAIEAAMRDAAAQLGVGSSSLTVERVEAREWSDSSLGCPRQGQMYAQVLTPGFLIVIGEARPGGGRRLEYHSDERGRVVLCSQT